jgi:hypothetical protein
VLVAALVASACAGADDDPPADAGPAAVPSAAAPSAAGLPTGCTPVPAADEAAGPSAQASLDAARPGDVVCITADEPTTRLQATASGTQEAPITIRGIGRPTIAGLAVTADHVVVENLVIGDGAPNPDGDAGISLEGAGLVVRSTRVIDPGGAGIACSDDPPHCNGALITDNEVRGADGTGIIAFGEGIVLSGNDVSGSIREDASDADGIRFFGRDIEIVGNHVHDISDQGYIPAEDRPHTDCFQTFDNDRPPTTDVLIHRNTCDRVDHQCLVAEGVTQGRSARLTFANNVCRNAGSQGILLRAVDEVTVANNLFLSPIEFHGILADDASLRVVNNVFVGSFDPYAGEALDLTADHNLYWNPAEPDDEPGWSEPNGRSGLDPLLTLGTAEPLTVVALPRSGSPLVDAGDDAFADGQDLLGGRRSVDGDGDGVARVDIGPVELQEGPSH